MTAVPDRAAPGAVPSPPAHATPWVVGGALVSGLGNYAFQVIATRALGDEAFAPLGVLWTIWYLLLTIFLFSIEAWVTRLRASGAGSVAAALPRLGAWVSGTAVVLTGLTWWGRDALFSGLGDLAVVVGLLVLTYGAFAVVRGELAGSEQFGRYAVLTGLESVVKVALLVPVALLLPTTSAMSWIMPLGPLVAVLWWLALRRSGHRSARRGGPRQGTDRTSSARPVASSPGRFLLLMAVPSAAAQVLLAAGPLVLVAMDASATQVSVFFVTITAARVPIVLAFGGLLTRVLTPMTRMAAEARWAKLNRIAVLTAAGSVLMGGAGAAAGAAIGPSLVALLFGAAFEPPAWLAAFTGFGVLAASGAMLLNQVLIAEGREVQLLPPWLAAVVVAALAIALSGGEAAWRVSVGFAAGETAAVAGLLLTILAARSADAGRSRAGDAAARP